MSEVTALRLRVLQLERGLTATVRERDEALAQANAARVETIQKLASAVANVSDHRRKYAVQRLAEGDEHTHDAMMHEVRALGAVMYALGQELAHQLKAREEERGR